MTTVEKNQDQLPKQSKKNQNPQNDSEEIIAMHYDKENSKQPENNESSTYSNIVFTKHELFFYSLPNVMAYDTVTIKNTGKTCVYYKWQKKNKPFILEDKKGDGIDRFYCHYADSKIFPDEERKFVFSFFSEKNGVFSEEWILATTPPLKNFDLHLHLSGVVHKYIDLYSAKVNELDLKIEKAANNTNINEFVLDLVDSIKETIPPKANMNNEKVCKFYFQYYNKEYNVEFSKRLINNLKKLNNTVMNEILGIVEEKKETPRIQSPIKTADNILEKEKINEADNSIVKHKGRRKSVSKKIEVPHENNVNSPLNTHSNVENIDESLKVTKTEPIKKPEEEFFMPKNDIEEKKYWNGSIDVIKNRINLIENQEHKENYLKEFNCMLHISHKKGTEESNVYNFVKNILLNELENINETSNKIREELFLPPYTFDLLTKKSLNEADLAKYEAEQKKKKDDFLKKNKKKPPAKGEEDEMEEYRTKLMSKLSENILIKLNDINSENNKEKIKDELLLSNTLDENYIDRLSRVRNFNNIKTSYGGFDNKYAVLRVDIEECKKIYVDDVDEEGNVIGNHLKGIDFLSTKDTIFQSLSYLLNNGVKLVLLLVDFGPKLGEAKNEFSTQNLAEYIEKGLEHPTYFCKNLDELIEYNRKVEDDDLKDNCCIIMENINFFPEECGFENYQEDIVNPSGLQKELSLYIKNKFLNNFTEKANIFVNDSIFSFDKYYPTVIDINCPIKAIGTKIQDQLKKITDFFSIENKNYILIMGDNDIFKVRGRKLTVNVIENNNLNQNKENVNSDQNNVNPNEEPNKPHIQENILDEGYVGGTEILDYSDEECLLTELLIINAVMTKFKKIYIYGKLALQFIQFLRNDYELFDNNLYKINENLFKAMKYILVKANILNIEIILPKDFKILNKEEFKKHLEPLIDQNGVSQNYTKEMKILLKRERIQNRLENAYTDPEELADNADYQRVKLEPEQIEHLKFYKEKTLTINKMPYCYDLVSEFTRAQEIEIPRKIFKTPLEKYEFNEKVYNKELKYPFEVISANEYYSKKKLEKEEQKTKLTEDQQKTVNEEANVSPTLKSRNIPNPSNPPNPPNPPTENQNQNENNNTNNQEVNNNNNEITEKNENNTLNENKKIDNSQLYDYEQMELVDFGESSYEELIKDIDNTYGIMWIGRLSPSKCENIFDNYLKIVQAILKRKSTLKSKFEEDQATKEVKLSEGSLKARKQLMNIFVKSNSVYEEIKETYKMILSGQANPDEFVEEDEGGQDEEQFSHDMHMLIDYYIDDDFELINSILKGKHISGFYGLDKEKKIEKVEEFDPKCLEDIINP